MNGTVLDENSAPVQNALISVASPSQVAHTSTDTSGKFSFLALIPDTYTLSVEKQGYESQSLTGVTVIADQNNTSNLATRRVLRTIGRVTTRAPSSLVKPGTTVDVYSIEPSQQDKLSLAGGGTTLNSAWSALSTVPGVYVAPNQAGYIGAGQSLSIRGGEYDQIGYEIDGVPVNRAFDNYPSGPASSLGQQELQVYTGVPPANAEANGLSGFINQVIRTGTYPGFSNVDLGIGGPAYYHKASFEIGGSTPSRNFSYYIGIGGFNQDTRNIDQYNATAYSTLWGFPLGSCSPGISMTAAPSCYGGYVNQTPTNPRGVFNPTAFNGDTAQGSFILGPYSLTNFSQATIADRDSVVNVHFGIPHKDGTKDDFQLLGMWNYINNGFYSSANDIGGVSYVTAIGYGQPHFVDGYQYNGASGVALPANFQSLTSVYSFPNVPAHSFDGSIPVNERDGFLNDQAIFKAQYTHNMGSNALFKVYGYTYYSDWLNTGPNSFYSQVFATGAGIPGAAAPDYELSSHTRGVSGSLIDQITPTNLINFTGSFTTSGLIRDNNTQYQNGIYPASSINVHTALAVLVDSSNPTNGLCYTAARVATTCYPAGGFAQFATLKQAFTGTVAPVPAGNCGGGTCEYFVVNDGLYATFNQVQPKFYQGSLSDEWHPNTKLTINGGVRFDDYQYIGASTAGTAARTLWYNGLAADTCINNTKNTVAGVAPGFIADKVRNLGLGAASVTDPNACGGVGLSNFTPNNNAGTQTYPEWEPRLGATYTVDPFTVVRASYGRYSQGPNSAFEQYNGLQQDFPYSMYYTYGFQQYGFLSPNHPVMPEVSNNYDFSFEHQFKGDVSVKVTPFLRSAQNQIRLFFLNQAQSFVSGLNVGKQTSRGVEFEVDKGDFSRQGLSGRLTFTYTNSYEDFTPLPNGSTAITPVNVGIANYNAYTKQCAPGGSFVGAVQFGTNACGSTVGGVVAAQCYTTGGAPDNACLAGSIANPYWNAPAQSLFDPSGHYPPYFLTPAAIGSQYNAIGAPYVGSLVLNERVGKFSIAPVVQLFAGQRYGAPLTTLGIAPDTCGGVLASTLAGDPRYQYGAPGGSPFDAGTCGTISNGIPNPYTKGFDRIGAFAGPTNVLLHLQMTYDISSKMQLVVNAANIVNACFGGTSAPWNVTNACVYNVDANGNGLTGGIGNLYNPGQAVQAYQSTPYTPYFAGVPFNLYVNLKVKI